MHYYSHHIGDFIRDTANLDDHQLATYLRLLWSYYDSEQPISGQLEDIAFAMRSDEKTVRLLLRHYFTETPDGWQHTRCDKEIQAFHAKQDKAKNSANARWNNPNAMRTQSERNASAPLSDANQEPITKNQEKTKTPRAEKPARFDPRSISMVDKGSTLQAAWDEWVAYRSKRARGMTPESWGTQADNFVAWHDQGLDVMAMVKTSIANGWQGIFPPKAGPPTGSKQSALEARNAAAVAQALGEIPHATV